MSDENNTPKLIEDEALDDASGGLLLPAVQKVREPASRLKTSNTNDLNSSAAGDGSV